MADANGTKPKKSLVLNAFVEMCKAPIPDCKLAWS